MKYKLIWLPVIGKRRDEERTQEPALAELREWVGGDIEIHARADYLFYVNEDGRREGFDRNAIASKMFGGELLGNVLVIHKK